MGGAKPGERLEEASPVSTEARWYAVETRCRLEKKVDTSLRRKGVESFLPLVSQTHRWSDRDKVVKVPLFRGYSFVRLQLSSEARRQVLETPGVIGLVGSPNRAVSIPASQIESLQRLLNSQAPCSLHPFLRNGQRVRICSGSLAGLEGILQSTESRSLVISIECIQRSVAVTIEGYDLEVV